VTWAAILIFFTVIERRSDYYLVVKIADDDGKKTEKNIFIGRDKEINEIVGDLKDNKSNKGTRLLLVGESGIGKSALLDDNATVP
jgi:ATP-dependent Clp protease ATP-binding subunit ClpA